MTDLAVAGSSATGRDLRIMHVIATDQRRGAEMFASDLIRALRSDGFVQIAVVMRPVASGGIDLGPTVASLRRLGARTSRLDMSTVLRLRSAARRFRPDIVQSHGGEALKASVLAALRAPIVYRRIGCAPPALRGGARSSLHRALMRRSTRIVAVAHAVASETIELLGMPAERVVTIPNGVDMKRLAASTSTRDIRLTHAIPPDAPVLASVAALTWEKDPAAHVRVGADVLRRLPQARHLIIGDGPMRITAERLAGRLGVAGRMAFLGSRADATELLAASDALLFASRPDGMEGMPGVLIEAAMLGVPAVAYDVAGVREVVSDGVTGHVIPWGQERALADRASSVLTDRSSKDRLGAAGRDVARRTFEIGAIAPRYASLYRELVGAARAQESAVA